MSPFLRAAMARADAEREARLLSTPGSALHYEPPPERQPKRVRRPAGLAATLAPAIRKLRAEGLEWVAIGKRLGTSASYASRIAKGLKR